MKQFLLTGGSGKLGTELKKILNCIAPDSKKLDIVNPASLYTYINNDNINTIIHCAAYTDVPGCEINRQKAILTNILGTKNIVDYLGYYRIVYISSDYVYGGVNGNYSETDKTAPFNFYGFTKLAGEAFIRPDKDLIIRTSFKPNEPWKHPGAFYDLYTSSDYVDIIAKDIAMLADSNITGIINVGTERKSIFDLAKKRNVNVVPISTCKIKDVNLPSDISMKLEKLNAIKKELIKE